MERRSRITLDDPANRGRLRDPRRAVSRGYAHSPGRERVSDVRVTSRPARQEAPAGSYFPSLEHLVHKSAPAPQPIAAPASQPQPVQPAVHHAAHPAPSVSVPPLNRNRTHPESLHYKHSAKKKHLPRQSRSAVLRRQMVKKVAKVYRAKHRRPLMPMVMTAMAVILFTVGLLVVFSSLRTDHTVKAQVKQLAAKTNDDDGMTDGVPSEDQPPGSVGSYRVAPDLPRIFSIEKLGVNARVVRVGTSASNEMKTPNNIYDVGWYDGSSKPGTGGTTVINGHVSGPTHPGVFYSIGSLKAGDKVKLERGDGQVFTYTVTSSQVYDNDKVDMTKVMTSSVPGKPALNFMTCTGRYNVRTNEFEKRVVVFAVQD